MGVWEDVLAPLKHMIAESISENAILVRIILILELYEEENFPEIKEASLLYMMDAEGMDESNIIKMSLLTDNTERLCEEWCVVMLERIYNKLMHICISNYILSDKITEHAHILSIVCKYLLRLA